MREMHLNQRVEVVRAMETLVRCVNNEDIIESWLMCGVADGDIDEATADEDLYCYCNDDNSYSDLMGLFLRIMSRAKASGGLYSDGVVSND